MVTNGQLRAALAILNADVDPVAAQVWGRTTVCDDTAGVERAMLAGLLYRVVGAQLRRSLAEAPDVAGLEDRARAAGPSGVAVTGEDEFGQAHFEAYWLTDRIAELYGGLDPVPPTLAAAAYTAEVSRTLLRLHREAQHDVRTAATPAGWESVLIQLDRARALARAAHAEAETVPHLGLVAMPVE